MTTSPEGKKRRALWEKMYGARYQKHYSSRTGCFYCGDHANTIDHCPPLSLCDLQEKKWFDKKKIGFYKVQCCRWCNQKLSNRFLLTLEERAAYILNSLERLADKFVIWGEDEMKEMSEEFQMMLRAKKLEQNITINRIQFCQQLLMRREDFPEFL